MHNNQKPNQVNHPWYIAVPTRKSEIGASKCPVRTLRYYYIYITEQPELRKARRRLFIPIKDNNAGKDLSSITISTCILILPYRRARLFPKQSKVRAVATSLQRFNKVDLKTVMKSGRWSRGITFTSFYLRDLCPHADRIRKADPVVAAGEIVLISSS